MEKKKPTTNDKVIMICNRNIVKSKDMLISLEKIRDTLENDENETESKHNKEVFKLMKKYIELAMDGYELTIVSLVEVLSKVEPKTKKRI
jgi:hypothetical protein